MQRQEEGLGVSRWQRTEQDSAAWTQINQRQAVVGGGMPDLPLQEAAPLLLLLTWLQGAHADSALAG